MESLERKFNRIVKKQDFTEKEKKILKELLEYNYFSVVHDDVVLQTMNLIRIFQKKKMENYEAVIFYLRVTEHILKNMRGLQNTKEGKNDGQRSQKYKNYR